MLEKGNYIPRESRFRRFLDNMLEEGEQMWRSIEKGPYVRPMIPDPDNTTHKGRRITRICVLKINNTCNIMDHNNGRPIPVSNNTKFLNCLQPEWIKYVTMRATRNHDLLAFITHSNASFSQSRASSSYSHSPQPYYVTHPSSVVDYEEYYQWELQEDAQEDKLTTAMMLLARAITYKFSTPTNNRLRTSSNTRNQIVIQDGKVDIQTKNVGYGENGNGGRQNMNQSFNVGNGEQMFIAMKDEAGGNLNDEENDFMLDNAYGDDTLEELTAAVIMMVRIQPVDDKTETEPKYNSEAVNEVNGSIIFDDPYVENNSGKVEQASNDHDLYGDIKTLAYNVQREAKNQKRLNNELKKQKKLLQKQLETRKEQIKTFESSTTKNV
ncbi:hypothetical protein Tco_0521955 [Tanacetum coccineum]